MGSRRPPRLLGLSRDRYTVLALSRGTRPLGHDVHRGLVAVNRALEVGNDEAAQQALRNVEHALGSLLSNFRVMAEGLGVHSELEFLQTGDEVDIRTDPADTETTWRMKVVVGLSRLEGKLVKTPRVVTADEYRVGDWFEVEAGR